MPMRAFRSEGIMIFNPEITPNKIEELQKEVQKELYAETLSLKIIDNQTLNDKFSIVNYSELLNERGLYWLTEGMYNGETKISDIFRKYGARAFYIGTQTEYYSGGESTYEEPELNYIVGADEFEKNDLELISKFTEKMEYDILKRIFGESLFEKTEFTYYVILNEKVTDSNKHLLQEEVMKYFSSYKYYDYNKEISIDNHDEYANVLILTVKLWLDIEKFQGFDFMDEYLLEETMNDDFPNDLTNETSIVLGFIQFYSHYKKEADDELSSDERVMK
ncbi:hypothetical protein ACWN8B_05770 [Vagococcus zengguangii]|uniref:Uncharacterized protein n=2 Tax=Vagococcus zengguangii TaxID=2571750 RepID=A0A4D7CZ86_9ENTE|nr:hypothetical protein [Vagococcus zengguangii]QCI86906.1 hypothetical protein FA707_07960 [Vagococcus zengguangii]